MELYESARAHMDAAAGYYNKNVRVSTPDGPVNVRIPIDGADVMDLRLWREDEVLPAIAPYVPQAPRLLHTSADPVFQVHQFIHGRVLNDLAPRGVPVPAHVPADVVRLLAQLVEVPREKLPALPPAWPAGEDTPGFGRKLSDLTMWVYSTLVADYEWLYTAFRIPADPVSAAESAWPTLTARPLVCVHADIHRKNMIIDDGRTVFLDWELALWGDPVYELAVHFHKMGYLPDERDRVLRLWARTLPPEYTRGWEHDLEVYLTHEQIKSAVVDTVRYAQLFVDPSSAPEPEPDLVAKLTEKLNNAYRHWGVSPHADAAGVEAILRRWAGR
ncbi:aminoglycoside phosphotransferase family protein [Planomonospora sp. ID67723]|uniref:aminoglycoside phosphotransferase family protein n=1 Tax=Planomonospora sp. ID67723 TaxID=2738134 RepID=UPI0018C3F9AF|nr:aminoglycoside phosphotransferase family protein [Planomonospora sp. ID67723]MBG0829787.1 aminoglycoside phosphotransferase family protein [Planomonospora sp. ID67723]